MWLEAQAQAHYEFVLCIPLVLGPLFKGSFTFICISFAYLCMECNWRMLRLVAQSWKRPNSFSCSRRRTVKAHQALYITKILQRPDGALTATNSASLFAVPNAALYTSITNKSLHISWDWTTPGYPWCPLSYKVYNLHSFSAYIQDIAVVKVTLLPSSSSSSS